MIDSMLFSRRLRAALMSGALALAIGFGAAPAKAQVTAYKQAVAEAASVDDGLAAYYRQSGYAPLWTGEGDVFRDRRVALIEALRNAHIHGLPRSRYDVAGLMQQMQNARTTRDIGLVEVELSSAFLRYAHDVQSGMLTPASIDPGIVREVPRRPSDELLAGFTNQNPRDFLSSLPPSNAEYRALMKERLRLEQVVANGTWGPVVPVRKLEPGDRGNDVVALRNRLIAMGYMDRSVSASFDRALEEGVMAFQSAHGLQTDGVAGKGTIEEINKPAVTRLRSVIVAMERERWMNIERGERHVLVNLADFQAKIVDHGEVTFKTRSVIGKNVPDQRSPEFSDVMEHMIINPSWHVPRSIMTKEYLPQLQNNPQAASHLIITDRSGRRVNREEMDFTQFSTRNFPFDMRQPPSTRNALGLVKFMFPNKHNIYLHDTPQKHLFKRETRAYSHGCIRLADPFDFAYALLARQESEPKSFFQGVLKTGRETKVDLVKQVPVHLIYRTATVSAKGKAEYRRDVYGRDAKIWDAMERAGVALRDVQS
ncbi:MAG: murein L,D-transpeptidase [Arenibacterium sp.]